MSIFKYVSLLLILILSISTACGETIDQYMARRKAFLAQQKKRSYTGNTVLTSKETIVSSILQEACSHDISSYNGTYSFDILSKLAEIQNTSTFKILKTMPKGGLLHIHSGACGPFKWLITNATYRANLYRFVCSHASSTAEVTCNALRFFKKSDVPSPSSYGEWMPVAELRAKSHDIAKFDEELYDSITLSHKEVAGQSNDGRWKLFQSKFSVFDYLVGFQPVFKDFMMEFLQQSYLDGVQHIELRGGGSTYNLDGDVDSDTVLDMLVDVVNTFNKNKSDVDKMSLRVIYGTLRTRTPQQLWVKIKQAVRARLKYPNFVIGFDVMGQEDTRTLEELVPTFLDAIQYAAQQGTTLPFYFHAGERLAPTDLNILDALLLNTTRIGHGFDLSATELLLSNLALAKNVCIETCPSSNEALGYVSDLRAHPARNYMALNVPLAISSDDPGLLRYEFVTYDWFQAVISWNVDLAGLKVLTRNSITYSGLSALEKYKEMSRFEVKWDKWIDEIIMAHS